MPPQSAMLAYGDHPQQRALVLLPDTAPTALLLFIHGGGWISGAPEDGLPVLNAAVRAGFAAASIGYRLAPEAVHPEHANDVADGVAAAAQQLDVPFDQVVLSGHSAGAQLIFWLAFERTTALRAGWDPSELAGLVGISGVFDLTRAARVAVMRRDWIRPAFGDESEWDAASPLSIVTGGLPEVLLLNAERDWGLHRQGERLAAALRESGVSCDRQVVPDRNHLSVVQRFGEAGDPAAAGVISLVRRVVAAG
jgi:acetyl esterase/lipase